MASIACIGAGYWGKNLIRNFSQLGSLKYICDDNPTVQEAFREQYPETQISGDFAGILEDSSLDGVCIATPAPTHFDLIMQSLSAGKHVFVEKPLCLDESEAEKCIQLAKDKGLKLMVGHLLWYHPMITEAKRLISAGDLGQIRNIYSNRLNMGLLRNEENVLWSFAPHDISMILGLLGSVPESSTATGSSYISSGIHDNVIGIMKFPDNVSAHVFVSWLNPFKEQKLVVVGDQAMLVFDDTLPWENKLAIYKHSVEFSDSGYPKAVKAEPEFVDLEQSEPLKNECQHFLDCIDQDLTPRTDGNEGLSVLRVLNQLQQSLDS